MTAPGSAVRCRLAVRVSTSGVFLAVYAALLLIAAVAVPWWRMECRAPQYGQRVLLLDVSPMGVTGDQEEIDRLGHYVGMRSVGTFAPVERAAAPYGVALVVALALALPWLPPGWLRRLAAASVVAVPVFFVADLWAWQRFAVTHLDPTASLSMIADRVDARVVGSYAVAQFKVKASFQTGFWLVAVAALNALAFLVAERPRKVRSQQRTRGVAAVAAAIVVIAGLAAPSSAHAGVLEVGGSTGYPTIGDAVAAAAPGDEVIVRAGVYRERVRVDRPLVLRGDPGAVIDGGGEGTVVHVATGPTTVAGLSIRGTGTGLRTEDAGIRIDGAPDCTVLDNQLDDVLFGILVVRSPRARVAGNHVTGKDLPIPRRGDGIRLFDSGDSVVDGNTLEHGRDFSIWHSDRVVSTNNTVRTGRYGLHYMYCDDNRFEDNVFEHNQVGGAIMYSRRLTLRRNRFASSRGPSAHGLLIKVGDDVVVEHNWFIDNTRGMFIEDSPSSRSAALTVRRNVVAGNDTGVALQPSVARAVFTENVFASNRVQVEITGRGPGGANVWSAGGRGNYWSDYVGFDADGDGIGDTPHRPERFFDQLADRWPGVGLLRLGPAAEALEMGARAFPIVRPAAMLVDEHPLIRAPSIPGAPDRMRSRPGLAVAGAVAILCGLLAIRRAYGSAPGGRA